MKNFNINQSYPTRTVIHPQLVLELYSRGGKNFTYQ